MLIINDFSVDFKTIKSIVPGSVTTYETPQEPSFLSSKLISAFDGPSTAIDRPPAPASLVKIENSAGILTIADSSPGPTAVTLLAPPDPTSPTVKLKGEPGT